MHIDPRNLKTLAVAGFDADFPTFPPYQYGIFYFDHFGYTDHLPKPDPMGFANIEKYWTKPTPSPAKKHEHGKRQCGCASSVDFPMQMNNNNFPMPTVPYSFPVPMIPEMEEKTPEDHVFVPPKPLAPVKKPVRKPLPALDVPKNKSLEHVVPVPHVDVAAKPLSTKEEAEPVLKRTYASVAAQPSSRANRVFDFYACVETKQFVQNKTIAPVASSKHAQPQTHVPSKIAQLLLQLRTSRP